MTNPEHPTIKTLFDQLDTWRHFAGFPLEARVDAFFGLYLPKVIENCLDAEEMHPRVIPQFPLKKDNNNQSDRVDFLAISKDGKRAFLVEIKTDLDSRRPPQDLYLRDAQKRELPRILEDFKSVAAASNSRDKYLHVAVALADMSLLELPEELKDQVRNGETRVPREFFRKIEVPRSIETKLEVVFIQPKESKPKDPESNKKKDFCCIYFEEFAKAIEEQGKLGCLFAEYLRAWQTRPAKNPPEIA